MNRPKKTQFIIVRVTKEEKEKLQAEAEKANTRFSKFIRLRLKLKW